MKKCILTNLDNTKMAPELFLDLFSGRNIDVLLVVVKSLIVSELSSSSESFGVP